MRTILPTLLLVVLALASPARAGAPAPAADDAVAAAVRASLLARSPALPGELELTVLGRADAAAPAPGERVVVGEAAGRWPRARVAVPVQHWRDGRVLRSRTVWVAVRWWRELDVYADDYAAGTPLAQLRSERLRVDVADAGDEPADAAGLDAGLRLARPVRRGRPLLAGDFESMPAVLRGDTVAVEVVRGAIVLHTSGRALADGAPGERIAVALGDGRAPVNTLVISPKAVRVED